VVWARDVTVVSRASLGASFQSPELWTLDALEQRLGPHFAKLEPVKDGFALPVG